MSQLRRFPLTLAVMVLLALFAPQASAQDSSTSHESLVHCVVLLAGNGPDVDPALADAIEAAFVAAEANASGDRLSAIRALRKVDKAVRTAKKKNAIPKHRADECLTNTRDAGAQLASDAIAEAQAAGIDTTRAEKAYKRGLGQKKVGKALKKFEAAIKAL